MAKRVRLRPLHADVMDAGARNWLIKNAKRNYWRVAGWIELEDLIQDGCMLWVSTRRRYTDAIFLPHVMRLWQVTYINHIHDLARQRTRMLETTFSQFDDDAAYAITNLEACDFSELLRLMAEAPGHLKAILIAMHVKQWPTQPGRRPDGSRMTISDRIALLAGVEPSEARMLRGYLNGL